jgi:hypothetical protein
MCQNPPPRASRAGWPAAGVKLKKNNNFIHSAPPQALEPAESGSPKLWHSLRQLTHQAYSELRLVLPSKTPATVDPLIPRCLKRETASFHAPF